jgi:hypothetical protein
MEKANDRAATRAPREERNLRWIASEGGKPGYFATEITFRGRRVRRFAGWTKEQARATPAVLLFAVWILEQRWHYDLGARAKVDRFTGVVYVLGDSGWELR